MAIDLTYGGATHIISLMVLKIWRRSASHLPLLGEVQVLFCKAQKLHNLNTFGMNISAMLDGGNEKTLP